MIPVEVSRSARAAVIVGVGGGLAGAAVVALGNAMVGAILVTGAAGAAALLSPAIGLSAIVVLFIVHPLAMRVAQVDLGVEGAALLVLSAWKEVALAMALVHLGWRGLRRWRRAYATGLVEFVAAIGPLPVTLAAVVTISVALVVTGAIEGSTAAAVNQARLLLFPAGLFVGLCFVSLDRSRLWLAYVLSAAAVAVFGIVQTTVLGWDFVRRYHGTPELPIPYTFTSVGIDGPRAAGTLSSPNEFAFMIGAALLIAVPGLLLARGRRLGGGAAVVAVLAIALGLSFSRSTIAATLLGIAVIVVAGLAAATSRREVARSLATVLLPAVLLTTAAMGLRGGLDLLASTGQTISGGAVTPAPGATATPPGPSATPGSSAEPRPSGPVEPPTDPSVEGHAASLRESLALVVEHPLGIGIGNVGARAVPGSTEKPLLVVESWYLSMALALGWLGLAWAIAFTIALFATGARGFRRAPESMSSRFLPALGLGVIVAVVGMVLPTMLEPQAADVPWMLLATTVPAAVAWPHIRRNRAP